MHLLVDDKFQVHLSIRHPRRKQFACLLLVLLWLLWDMLIYKYFQCQDHCLNCQNRHSWFFHILSFSLNQDNRQVLRRIQWRHSLRLDIRLYEYYRFLRDFGFLWHTSDVLSLFHIRLIPYMSSIESICSIRDLVSHLVLKLKRKNRFKATRKWLHDR